MAYERPTSFGLGQQEDDFNVLDSENYRGYTKEEPLSHSQLVAVAMKKCLDARAEEMKEGYITIKRDKFGNQLPIYIQDTRKKFIECIEALKMILGVDMNDNTRKNIDDIEKELKESLDIYIKFEKNEWETVSPLIKKEWIKDGKFYMPGKLTQGFSYYNEFLLDKVSAYTKVYIELDKRAKELNYFKEEDYEG